MSPSTLSSAGNDRQPCFFTDVDRVRYLQDLREITSREKCAVHAYVLMTNHVHLLMTPTAARQISHVVQSLGLSGGPLGGDMRSSGENIGHVGGDVAKLDGEVRHVGADVRKVDGETASLDGETPGLDVDLLNPGVDLLNLGVKLAKSGVDLANSGCEIPDRGVGLVNPDAVHSIWSC